ncbi:TPA: cysteine--tRNA ligase [Candidatus Falkowbacteria bacterium]|nr:cysteine--tRNA ligase [Candidatus Falkowbacteria bacterium]
MLKLYNTLTRTKEDFAPLKKNTVKMYTCGPTVYNHIHIGNYSTYLFSDLLKRYLNYTGYKVKDVMNITDVDDKTIKGSITAGKTLTDFTAQYEKMFYNDLKLINILPAKKNPRATRYIKQIVKFIKKLEENGYAYQTADGSVYFDISEFKTYGQLANLDNQNLKADAGGRMASDEYQKDNYGDFALWKAYTAADGDIKWKSPWGYGRPGWHIECSAMIMKLLGDQIDIHIGGEDLVFPHHQNEIAQTEAVTGKPFVKYWLHRAHLKVDDQKMSKSLGNFLLLNDLAKTKAGLMAFRYLIVTSHYRQPLNFTMDSLQAAAEGLNKVYHFIDRLTATRGDDSKIDETLNYLEENNRQFAAAMDDDLNTPQAIAALFSLINLLNKIIDQNLIGSKSVKLILKHLKKQDKVWAFIFSRKSLDPLFQRQIETLITERNTCRTKKDFTAADKIREQLLSMGVEIQDEGSDTKWSVK